LASEQEGTGLGHASQPCRRGSVSKPAHRPRPGSTRDGNLSLDAPRPVVYRLRRSTERWMD
jgi:hypothetical protein